jgi:hypothetical protein
MQQKTQDRPSDVWSAKPNERPPDSSIVAGVTASTCLSGTTERNALGRSLPSCTANACGCKTQKRQCQVIEWNGKWWEAPPRFLRSPRSNCGIGWAALLGCCVDKVDSSTFLSSCLAEAMLGSEPEAGAIACSASCAVLAPRNSVTAAVRSLPSSEIASSASARFLYRARGRFFAARALAKALSFRVVIFGPSSCVHERTSSLAPAPDGLRPGHASEQRRASREQARKSFDERAVQLNFASSHQRLFTAPRSGGWRRGAPEPQVTDRLRPLTIGALEKNSTTRRPFVYSQRTRRDLVARCALRVGAAAGTRRNTSPKWRHSTHRRHRLHHFFSASSVRHRNTNGKVLLCFLIDFLRLSRVYRSGNSPSAPAVACDVAEQPSLVNAEFISCLVRQAGTCGPAHCP